MAQKLKISVLVPVYNTADTLDRCLRSLQTQTLQDIEIVCVDDGSDARTKAELSRLAGQDGRVRVITHEKNRGLLYARKTGLENARGEYIMFLDSDDEFLPQACEKAYEAIVSAGADVVQFGTEIVYEAPVAPETEKFFSDFLSPSTRAMRGEEIFRSAFEREKQRGCGWNVWNHIYKAELVKKVLPYIPEERIVLVEDFLINFIALYYAEKGAGLYDKLVRYYIGGGVTTTAVWKAGSYKTYCAEALVYRKIRSFILQEKLERSVYEEINEKFYLKNTCSVIDWLKTRCPVCDRTAMFREIVQNYPPEYVAAAGALVYGENDVFLSKLAARLPSLCTAGRQIKKIGFFYHRLYNGGVERVLSELIPQIVKWGYEVVFFCEEATSKDYEIPAECNKIIIQKSLGVDRSQYKEHVSSLCRALKQENVDVLVYQSATSPWLSYDILAAKMMGISVVVTLHEIVSLPLLLNNNKQYIARQTAFRFADGVQAIVKSDAAYLRALGCNARYIPNPLTTMPAAGGQAARDPDAIVWVGRLHMKQKHPEQALLILQKVLEQAPDAHLYIVGTAENACEERFFRKFAEEQGVGEHVTFCGFCKDPSEYYRKASVLLMTSAYEAAPMVLNEGLCAGLPVVLYSLPYVAALQDNEGCISVEQGDVDGAAGAIVKILQDDALREKMSAAAKAKAEELASFDLRSAWEEMFASLGLERRQDLAESDLRTALETMLDFYEKGLPDEDPALLPGGVSVEDALVQTTPLWKKAAKFWVEKGTFATLRRAMVYVYRRLRRKKQGQ